MKNKIQITIPKPCHENWLEMSATEKGRFCTNCKKDVIDFTKASDREIILAYNSNGKLCGRFNSSQINRTIIIPKEKKSIWVIITASIIAFLGIGNQEAKAQQNIKTEQTDNKKLNNTTNTDSDKETRNFKGIVYDDSKTPLPGVNIWIKKSKKSTQTNFNGEFSIQAKKGDILIFSYIGFTNVKIKLKNETMLNLHMQEASSIMGAITIQD
jgi:hypothetical protein